MVDPINYSGLLEQLDVSPLLQAAQIRQQRNRDQTAQANVVADNARQDRVVQLATSKFTAQQEQDTAYQAALHDYTAHPTAQGLVDLSARFPEHQAALEAGFKTYTAGQQQDLIGTTTRALAGIAANRPDLALAEVDTRLAALKAGGIDTTQTQAVRDMLASGDPVKMTQAKAFLATVLSGAVGADHASSILSAYGMDAARNADDARADAALTETQRHNRVTEGQGEARVGLSAAAGARAAAGRGRGGKRGHGAYSDAQLDALIQ